MTKVLLLVLSLLSCMAHAYIVGEDKRVFAHSYEGELSEVSRSVALIHYKDSKIEPLRDALLEFPMYQPKPLCESIPDLDKTIVAGATAFLVAPDVILTAGHNLLPLYKGKHGFPYTKNRLFKESEKPSFYFSDGDEFDGGFDKERMYQGVELIEGVFAATDFALIRLDRKVLGRKPLELDLNGSANIKDEVVLIGHPLGLPLTLSFDGQITQTEKYDLRSNVTGFHGNSGGPLIRIADQKVVGLVSRVHYEVLPIDPLFYGPTLDLSENGCLVFKKVTKEAGHLLDGFTPTSVIDDYKDDFEQQKVDRELLQKYP